MPRNLAEWLDYQSSTHPQNIALGLERVHQVWQALGKPQPARKIITVAGTNGKGSCVAMLDSILRTAGYTVGAYTSPELIHYNERIGLHGKPVDDQTLCAAFEKIEQTRTDTPLTSFEFGTLAALSIFSQHNLDIALLEVGLGGRLDAVNILDADIALVTGIALDHMDWLGDNLESIGAEKAGIFRANRPAIYASVNMPNSIAQTAQQVGAKLIRLGLDYQYQAERDAWHWWSKKQNRHALPLPNLRGAMQLGNAAAVLQVLECIQDEYPIAQADIRQGLLNVQLAGRMAIYPRRARWILDVAHNPQAIAVLAEQISNLYVPGKIIGVAGVLRDKLQTGLFDSMLTQVDTWYVLDLSHEVRGAAAQAVQTILNAQSIPVYGKPEAVFDQVDTHTGPDDLVVVFGSFITVAAAMRWMQR